MADPLLSITELRGGYGEKPVLQGVNLSVARGEIAAVIGRNGVGKSTLMKSLIGLLPLSSGSVVFKGQEIAGLEAHHRARLGVGYVPQGREVFPRMTVEENLTVGYRGSSSERARDFDRIYSIFPILAERRLQRAGTMSGGQQQQLAIGRILVAQPDLILLDEPSEGIQPSIVEEIGEVVKRINRETGLTVVFVEQNLDLIRSMAQRCYVMDKGRIIATVTPEELDDRETVRRFLSV